MKKYSAFLGVLLALSCVLSACSAESASTAAVDLPQTATATPQPMTIESSTTPQPTETPKPTKTPRPTKTPTPTLTYEQQLDGCDFEGEQYYRSLSPDGLWIASVCGNNHGVIPDEPDTYTKVSSLDGQLTWNLPFGATIGNRYGKIYGSLYPFHWTRDGYLFLTFNPQIDGYFYQLSGMALLRLDLKTGRVVESIRKGDGGYEFAFSPRGDKLAYMQQHVSPLKVTVWDLPSGDLTTFTIS